MFNLDDYENILDYFIENPIPEDSKYNGLRKTVKKLKISFEEINYRKEVSEKIKEYQEELAKIDEED